MLAVLGRLKRQLQTAPIALGVGQNQRINQKRTVFPCHVRPCHRQEDDSIHRSHHLIEYLEGDAESVVDPVNADHFTFTAQLQFDVPCDEVHGEVDP